MQYSDYKKQMYTVVTALSASNLYKSVIYQHLNFLLTLVLSSHMNQLITSGISWKGMEKVKFNDSFLEHQRPLFGYTGKVQERWHLMTFPFNTKGDLSVTLKILLSIGKLAF